MEWTEEAIEAIVEKQRAFFRSGQTLNLSWRIEQLRKLKKALQAHEAELETALFEDLGRSPTEAYFCDIGSTIREINETIHGLKKWARPELHLSGLCCFPSIFTRVYKLPYGNCLIISPYNFPILLSFGVLAACIAGGNTVVLKSSSKSSACTALMKRIIVELYPEEYITLVDGDHKVADLCLSRHFDKIFYTGSPAVAKHVLAEAAKNLTPTALELGGETGNWCIVRKDADLRDAAEKIAFLKLCNSGQICININQVAVAREVAEDFIACLKDAFEKQIGPDAPSNPEYARLIAKDAYEKCVAEVAGCRERIVYGGYGDPHELKYAPTVIYPVKPEEEIVRHELFCPLLPVVPFPDGEVEALLQTIAEREHGLALYLFTKDKKWAKSVMMA